jgi:putative ABC transport system permease protein
MWLRNLKVGWRQLIGDPAYSAVVVLGLASAIASAYLVAALLADKLLPDVNVIEPSRVVRFELRGNIPSQSHEWLEGAPFVLRDALLQARAPIASVARVQNESWSLKAGDRVIKAEGLFVDPQIASIFSLQAIAGNLDEALKRPDSIALTEATALRLFGTNNALGLPLALNGQTLTVTAVLPQRAGNSELQFDALVTFDGPANAMPDLHKRFWLFVSGRVFARLAPGASADQVGLLGQALFDASPVQREIPAEWTENGRKAAYLRAIPLDRLPLQGAHSKQNRRLLGGLSAAAATMLALAAINYTNLTSVRTLRRQREIGIRKSLGASPSQLTAQFISESVLVALLAGVVGLVVAGLLAPAFSDLLELRLDHRYLAPSRLLLAMGSCAVLGVLTGWYPASIAFHVRCTDAMVGRDRTENASGRWLRRATTTVQFAAAISLAAVASVVVWQSKHASQIDRGFRTEGLLAIDLPRTASQEAAIGLREALARQPGVLAASWSADVPGRDPTGTVSALKGLTAEAAIRISTVDADFFDVYGIRLEAGRVAAPSSSQHDRPVVLDSRAAAALGFASAQEAVGRTLGAGAKNDLRIAAVTAPVRQESARDEAMPQAFFLSTTVRNVLTLRTADAIASRRAVEAAWPRYFPNEVLAMEAVDAMLSRNNKQDRQIGILIACAGLFALLLASFGVYALAAFTVRRKTREILIRKLHGAGRAAIFGRLMREFGSLLAAGAAIGLPLGWYLGEQYLGSFVLRAPVGGWPFAGALLAVALTTLLASLRHVLAALATRPAQVLQC